MSARLDLKLVGSARGCQSPGRVMGEQRCWGPVLIRSQVDPGAGPLVATSQCPSQAAPVAALGLRFPIYKVGRLIPTPRVVGKPCRKVHVKALCKLKEGSGFSCGGSTLRPQRRTLQLRSDLDLLVLLMGVSGSRERVNVHMSV